MSSVKSESEQIQNALTALKQKFSGGIPNGAVLSKEQRAWLALKLQAIAEGTRQPHVRAELQKIRNRLAHATEDIPDKELQKMVSFVFDNIDKINKVIKLNEAINEEK